MLAFGWSVHNGMKPQKYNSRDSGSHGRTAVRGGTSAHGKRLPTGVRYQGVLPRASGKTLTSFNRFVSGNALTKSITVVPCPIRSETIAGWCEVSSVPKNGNRFGCSNRFHINTRQNFCPIFISLCRVANGSYQSHLFQVDGVRWFNSGGLDRNRSTLVPSKPHI